MKKYFELIFAFFSTSFGKFMVRFVCCGCVALRVCVRDSVFGHSFIHNENDLISFNLNSMYRPIGP